MRWHRISILIVAVLLAGCGSRYGDWEFFQGPNQSFKAAFPELPNAHVDARITEHGREETVMFSAPSKTSATSFGVSYRVLEVPLTDEQVKTVLTRTRAAWARRLGTVPTAFKQADEELAGHQAQKLTLDGNARDLTLWVVVSDFYIYHVSILADKDAENAEEIERFLASIHLGSS